MGTKEKEIDREAGKVIKKMRKFLSMLNSAEGDSLFRMSHSPAA